MKSRRARGDAKAGGREEKGELLSSAPRGSDNRSRVLARLEFASPNRKAYSQAKEHETEGV